jgi:hypothetical protein
VNSKHSQETFLLQQHHTYQKSSYFKTAPSKKRAKISSFYQQFNNICINKNFSNIISTINIITRQTLGSSHHQYPVFYSTPARLIL